VLLKNLICILCGLNFMVGENDGTDSNLLLGSNGFIQYGGSISQTDFIFERGS